jgi:hypothetical protein
VVNFDCGLHLFPYWPFMVANHQVVTTRQPNYR